MKRFKSRAKEMLKTDLRIDFMEYKALSRGSSDGSASTRNKKARVRKSTRSTQSKTESNWGALLVDADEFAELESCMTTPAKPTQSIVKGAALIQRLYVKR